MKHIIFILSVSMCMLASCSKDNYEQPNAPLNGRLVYEGNPISVRQGISVVQLYQPGWQDIEPIAVQMKQDGTFSSLLFKGSYKLVPIEGNGPFIPSNADTINVEVNGPETTIDVPVTPYFTIFDADIQMNGSALNATFKIKQVVATATLDKVALFVGNTLLVDNLFNAGKAEMNGASITDLTLPISLGLTPTGLQGTNAFVRIGVKAKQSAEYIFTPVEKIN